MKNTPRKNALTVRARDKERFAGMLWLRASSVAASVFLISWIFFSVTDGIHVFQDAYFHEPARPYTYSEVNATTAADRDIAAESIAEITLLSK